MVHAQFDVAFDKFNPDVLECPKKIQERCPRRRYEKALVSAARRMLVAPVAQAAFRDQTIELVLPYDPPPWRRSRGGERDGQKPQHARSGEKRNRSRRIGSARVAKAPADGYTILYGSSSGFM